MTVMMFKAKSFCTLADDNESSCFLLVYHRILNSMTLKTTRLHISAYNYLKLPVKQPLYHKFIANSIRVKKMGCSFWPTLQSMSSAGVHHLSVVQTPECGRSLCLRTVRVITFTAVLMTSCQYSESDGLQWTACFFVRVCNSRQLTPAGRDLIIRPHRSDTQRQRPIDKDRVAWPVCLCVCLSVGHVRELHRSRCRLGADSRGPRNHTLGEWAIYGDVRPNEKHGKSLFIAPSPEWERGQRFWAGQVTGQYARDPRSSTQFDFYQLCLFQHCLQQTNGAFLSQITSPILSTTTVPLIHTMLYISSLADGYVRRRGRQLYVM